MKTTGRFVLLAVVAVLAGNLLLAEKKTAKPEVPPGFDRPLVVDRYLERKVAALEGKVAALEKTVGTLQQQVQELQADAKKQ